MEGREKVERRLRKKEGGKERWWRDSDEEEGRKGKERGRNGEREEKAEKWGELRMRSGGKEGSAEKRKGSDRSKAYSTLQYSSIGVIEQRNNNRISSSCCGSDPRP